jgi:hypothetical protein
LLEELEAANLENVNYELLQSQISLAEKEPFQNFWLRYLPEQIKMK